MLTISTIPEALAELAKQTGRAWTDSELLDLAANLGIELHAAPPITAQTTIQKFVIGEGLVEKFRSGPGHARLAVLFPWQVGQLWLSGETLARHTERHDEIEGEYQWFTEPVRVTREQVRIKAATLEKILTIWRKEQPAPATDTATPAPAETREQRQDRRLQACINAGLVMPKNSFGRLPKGVDKVAELEGVTRQAFSSEVKAALERMQRLASAKSEGVTVRRI